MFKIQSQDEYLQQSSSLFMSVMAELMHSDDSAQ